jgi:uncharacterized repeat protein (TIGR03847 family)
VSRAWEFEAPSHFTAGAIGPPGQRVFYLQAAQGRDLVTVKVEKEQVRALGEYLATLLSRLPRVDEERPLDTALADPVDPAWAVGSIAVGYDPGADRITVELTELTEQESGDEAATGRVHVTRAQAAGFVEQARDLVRAGRPLCPVCSEPMDPGGHRCPRSNGHALR